MHVRHKATSPTHERSEPNETGGQAREVPNPDVRFIRHPSSSARDMLWFSVTNGKHSRVPRWSPLAWLGLQVEFRAFACAFSDAAECPRRRHCISSGRLASRPAALAWHVQRNAEIGLSRAREGVVIHDDELFRLFSMRLCCVGGQLDRNSRDPSPTVTY